MLAEGKNYMTIAWWQVTLPGLAIMLTALSLNLVAGRLGPRPDRVVRIGGPRLPRPGSRRHRAADVVGASPATALAEDRRHRDVRTDG